MYTNAGRGVGFKHQAAARSTVAMRFHSWFYLPEASRIAGAGGGSYTERHPHEIQLMFSAASLEQS